jgi:hypothetical protein
MQICFYKYTAPKNCPNTNVFLHYLRMAEVIEAKMVYCNLLHVLHIALLSLAHYSICSNNL